MVKGNLSSHSVSFINCIYLAMFDIAHISIYTVLQVDATYKESYYYHVHFLNLITISYFRFTQYYREYQRLYCGCRKIMVIRY